MDTLRTPPRLSSPPATPPPAAGLRVGYARVSTDAQDLTTQRDALAALGVAPERTYVDHGLTGTSRARPGLREALTACRAGTSSWSPSSTGSPARSPTPATSPTSSPPGRSS